MLDLWSYKAGFKEQAGRIERELATAGAKLEIRAAVGAGRHSIVKQLARSMDIAVLEVPSFDDLDAPLHSLVQLATHAKTLDAVLTDSGRSLVERTTAAALALASSNRPLIVLMPVPRAGAWRESDDATRLRIEQMLGALVDVAPLRLAVMATPETRLRKKPFTRALELTAPKIGAAQIQPDQLHGELAQAAGALATWMAKVGWASTPLEARLQVGLIALGERPEDVALQLQALARKLVQQLQRRPQLSVAVHKLLLARRALPAAEVARVSGVEPRWQPLLTACIGYGDDEIRVPEVTRQVLLDALDARPEALEHAHAALAQYHESLDGARSLRSLAQDQAINWMEKVHHLALGGEPCAAKWAEQEPAGREQLWERARHLSHQLHRYSEAAQLYQSCLTTFGDDAYSSHYLAYNLERSHSSLPEIRRGYHFAVEQDAENPWWQQRWIRFLIAHGTLAEARTAWQRAVRHIDPDGAKLRRSSWLALNLHCGVARRWMALGRLEEAREVLTEVPQRWLDQEAELRELLELLTAQQQALTLGESVYPSSVPLAARWKPPRSLRQLRAGRHLLQWAPGRVVQASAAEVTVVVAPTSEEAQQLTFEAEHWQRIAGEPAEDAEGFFELGTYEGGEQVVRHVPDDGDATGLYREEAELLARMAT